MTGGISHALAISTDTVTVGADNAVFSAVPRGSARGDDLRVISGIIYVIRNGLPWKDAPCEYGPPKTLYNRFVRWSRMGVFNRIFAALAGKAGTPERLMMDATHLKAHRTAASLHKKGGLPAVSVAREAA
jgi:putative transposase